MAQQIINLGGIANDGTGDLLRTAFDKVNTNFTETYNNFNLVYNRIESNANIKISSNTISSTNTNGNINLLPNGTGSIRLGDADSRVAILATTTSTSYTSGALTVAGGVGITGNVYAAGNIHGNVFHGNGAGLIGVSATSFAGGTVPGQTSFQNTTSSTDVLTGAVTIGGGLGVAGNFHAGGSTIRFTGGTASTSPTNGLLVVSGGVGVSGNLNIGSTTPSVSNTSGALKVAGGVGIAGNTYIGGNLNITGVLSAGSFDIGTFYADVTGNVTSTGTSIFNNSTFNDISVSNLANITSTNTSSSITTGALKVAGGTGIVGNLHVGGIANITGALTAGTINVESVIGNVTSPGTSNFNNASLSGNLSISSGTASGSTSTGALVVSGGVGVSGNLNVGASIIVGGNLTVNGTTTTINSTTLSVDDKNVVLADTASPTDAAADGGGITLKGTSDKTIIWNNSTGRWSIVPGLDVPAGIQNTPIGNATANTGAFTTLTASGATTFTAATVSNSTTTGTVIVTGGVGVSGNVYAAAFYGDGSNLTGISAGSSSTAATVTSNAQPNITSTGTLSSLSVSGNVTAGNANIIGTTTSINSTTGALIVGGGVGVSGNLNVGGTVATLPDSAAVGNIDPITSLGGSRGLVIYGASESELVLQNSTSGTTGSSGLRLYYGFGTPRLHLKENTDFAIGTNSENWLTLTAASSKIVVEKNTAATSTTSGALQVKGGVGVEGSIYANNAVIGNANINGTTTSTSTSTGALIVGGGAGIAGNLYIGGVASVLRSLEKITLDSNAISSNITDSRAADTTGHVFYYSGSLTSNWTFNMQSLGLSTGQGTVVTIIINQGAAAYLPTQFQIDGAAQTIKWYGGSSPSGNASKVDVLNFTVICTGVAQYLVLGQLVAFS